MHINVSIILSTASMYLITFWPPTLIHGTEQNETFSYNIPLTDVPQRYIQTQLEQQNHHLRYDDFLFFFFLLLIFFYFFFCALQGFLFLWYLREGFPSSALLFLFIPLLFIHCQQHAATAANVTSFGTMPM